MATAVQSLGPLDIFVNSAGLFLSADIATLKTEDLDRLLTVNVRAAVIGIQAAAAAMKDGGRIVTVGSGRYADGGGWKSIYSMTKSALAGLVRGAAIDLAPRAITVNKIQPGPTATDMNPPDGPYAKSQLDRIPLGDLERTPRSQAWSLTWLPGMPVSSRAQASPWTADTSNESDQDSRQPGAYKTGLRTYR